MFSSSVQDTREPILNVRVRFCQAKMVVVVTLRIHHPAPMPEGCSPPAPIRMGIVRVKNEPAAFHFRIAQLSTSPACHLAFVERQVHMLGSVSMLIVDPEFADAFRKTP